MDVNRNNNLYQVELYYGHETTDTGVYHCFEITDPDNYEDDDEMAKRLATMLDIPEDSENFHWDSMYVALPTSVVEKIKADAIKEFWQGIQSSIPEYLQK